MKFYLLLLSFCVTTFCLSQDYAYQDSISGYQTCVAYNSINDGHPGPPKQPFFQLSVGHVFDESTEMNLCASNTFAENGFFRNSLFSMNVGNVVFQDNDLEIVKTIGGSWQHTWFYDTGKLPTVASLLSVQYPFDGVETTTEYQLALFANKNVAKHGVSYFNAFLDLQANSKANFSVLAGYKFFATDNNNLFLDVLVDPSDSITLEAAYEINLPNGSVISPGFNYQRDLITETDIFGLGLFILYQTL